MDLYLFYHLADFDKDGKLVRPPFSIEFAESRSVELQEAIQSLKILVLDTQAITSPEGWQFQIRQLVALPWTECNPRLSTAETWPHLVKIGISRVEGAKKRLRRIEYELGQSTPDSFELQEQKRAVSLAFAYCDELIERFKTGQFIVFRIWDFFERWEGYFDYRQREVIEPPITKNKTVRLTKEKLAIFYRTLQHHYSYPEFIEKEKSYLEVKARHGFSENTFGQVYPNARKLESLQALADLLSLDVLNELVAKLPHWEGKDRLRIEIARLKN